MPFSLTDVGGMTTEVADLKNRILGALALKRLGRCVLLYGPPGTGKSLLVKALTNDLGVPTVYMTVTDILSKSFAEAESFLCNIFKSTRKEAPRIIVIDNIDLMCPKPSQLQTGLLDYSIVGVLLTLLDGLASVDPLKMVIGITNSIDNVDPALLKVGRFASKIEIGFPTALQRKDILEVMLKTMPHDLTSEDLETVARNAHGYVGEDLYRLVDTAYFHAQDCRLASLPREEVKIAMKDLVHAGQCVQRISKEMHLEAPMVKWADIGGYSDIKMRLQISLFAVTKLEAFSRLAVPVLHQAVLMYGPSGCSKTLLARALANESNVKFVTIMGREFYIMHGEESDKCVHEVFKKARSAAPCIIFIDEIDTIVNYASAESSPNAENRVLTLSRQLDDLRYVKDVAVIAATNRPDLIDSALLRSGRFTDLVYVPLPDSETRQQIFEMQFSKMPVADVSLEFLVESTQNYSGAEIVKLCHKAGYCALKEDIKAAQILTRHFATALAEVKPCTDPQLLEIYAKFSLD